MSSASTDTQLQPAGPRFASCPACGGTEFAPFAKHIDAFRPPETWQDFFYGSRETLGPIDACEACGFHFLRHPSERAEHFYRTAEADDYLQLEPQRDKYFRKLLDDAIKNAPEIADYTRAIDYGCAAGNWLAQFPDSVERIGVELNADFDPVLAGKGIKKVERADAIDFDRPAVISAFDFVEHMEEPLDFLRELAALPHADASAFVFGVPDLGRAWAKMLGSRYYLYCPMHFNYFDADTITGICERAFPNHRVLTFNSPIMHTNLDGVLKWIAPKLGDGPLGKIDLPIGYRSNVIALAVPKS